MSCDLKVKTNESTCCWEKISSYTVFIRLNAVLEYTPHLTRRMRRLLEDNKKNLSTTWSFYTIQKLTILSQQNNSDNGTFKLHNIYKRFTVTVVSD